MAIVLEVSLTLNPGNQIAYLADDTGLIVGTEYVIAGTHIAADTRFTYNGNLDIVLTKQPIAVPTNNYATPVSINTVPLAAPAPPVATYPYSVKNQLAAASLNHDFEFSPGAVPPQSALGGAGRFKYWIDTSTPLPSLRQCVVPRASTTYNAADWILLGTVDAAAHKFHFNGDVVDFVGGGGTTNIFNVTNLTVGGATNLTTLSVTGASTLTTLNVTGASRLPTITGPTTINGATTINGTTTITGAAAFTVPLTVATGIHYTGVVGGNAIGFGWDGNIENYVDGTYVGATVIRITAGNGLSGGGGASGGVVTLAMSGVFSGVFNVTSNINAAGFFSTNGYVVGGNIVIDGAGNFTGGSVNSAGTVTAAQLTSTGNINASGTIGAGAFSTGGVVYAGNNVNSPLGHFTDCHADHDLTIGNYLYPTSDGASYCGLAAIAWAGVESYAYYTKSDPSLKRDIEPVPPGCLGLVNAIEPRMYKLNLEADEDWTHWGFLAPEVGEAMRRVGVKFDGVKTEGDVPASLAYNELIAVLWGAVREMTERLEALEGAR